LEYPVSGLSKKEAAKGPEAGRTFAMILGHCKFKSHFISEEPYIVSPFFGPLFYLSHPVTIRIKSNFKPIAF